MADKVLEQLVPWRLSSSNGKVKANIVVAGTTGSGKSALVNALFGEEVVKEEAAQNKVRKGDKHTMKFHGSSVTVWDTYGFGEPGSKLSDEAFDSLDSISIQKREPFTLLYTISISKTRFESNCNDIKGMKMLSQVFHSHIWNNALVVFTFADQHFEIITRGIEDKKEKKEVYKKKLEEWESTVQQLLTDEVVIGKVAKNIPFATAGYINSETQVLDFECKGKSWVLDIWQKIAQAAPLSDKPLLLDICISKFYDANFVYWHSYLSLMETCGAAYKERIPSEISVAYAFLHLLIFRLDNIKIVSNKLIQACEDRSSEDTAFWTNMSNSVKVVVTGLQSSGKTALINAMSNSSCSENASGVEHQATTKLRETNCMLIEQPLHTLTPEHVKDSSLVILCLKFNDTKRSMTNVLQLFAKKECTNFLIVLTFANVNTSHEEYTEVIKDQIEVIKSILTELEITSDIEIVPAGYRTEMIIKDDPTNSHWIVDLWLSAISQAKLNAQPALIALLNYTLHNKLFPKKMAQCKAAYMQGITSLLLKIVSAQKIKL